MRFAVHLVAAVALATLMARTTLSAEGFVRADGTQLTLDGKPYRAIGVNVPHLSQAYMGTWLHWRAFYGTREAMRRAMVEAVVDAEQNGVAFIRFFAGPGYPRGTAEVYLKEKEEYWRRMDALVDLCRAHHVKLVPSLSVLFSWNLVYGELRSAVFDPKSKTHAATYSYVREFVSRYKDDPTVLMWELQNEAFLAADVNPQDRPAPARAIYPEGATAIREKYTSEDTLRFEELIRFYREMASFIKALDPNHLVTSGDAGVREESMCRRETFPDFKWRNDTPREHLSNLLQSQPEPLDVFSLHMYGNFTGRRKVGGLSNLDFLLARVRAMHAAGAPVLVGELGQRDPDLRADPEAKWTRAAIDALDHEGVGLMALWAWHFPWHDKTYNIPSGASQPRLMQRVGQFNRQHAHLDDKP